MALDGGTAVVNVIANGAGLSASIASAVKGGISKATGALTSSSNELGSQIGAVFSTAATVGAVALAALTVKGISDFQSLGAEVRVLEKQLGLTAEQASIFHAQATALGISTDKLSIGFGIFAKNLANAAPALEKYGITAVRTASGQVDFAKTLDEVRAKFQALPEGIDRTAFAMNVFGRSGKALLPFLSASSEELAKFTDNAERAGLIMSQDDVDAARALSIAQRELGDSFKGLEVSLARAVIPLLTGIADALAVVVRAISPLLPALRDLGIIWLGYKAFTFIPGLLLAIGSAFEAMGAEQAAGGLLSAAAAMEGLGIAALPVAGLIVAVGGALLSVTGVINNFADAIEGVVSEGLKPFEGAAAISAATGLSMAKAFDIFNKAVAKSPDGVVEISTVIDNLRVHMDKAGNSVRNFAGLTNKHLKEFKTGVVDSVQVSIGAFKNLDAAFVLTTKQLQNQANAAVKIAQQEHNDLRKIFGDKSLTDTQKQALAQLAPDQRHAFAEAGQAVRQQIAQDAVRLQRLNSQTFNQVTTNAKNTLKTGFTAAGKGATDGLVAGIQSGSGAVVTAASILGHNVIQALRDAMGVASPSKHTIKIGHELMEGLIIGMNERFRKIQSSLQSLIPLIQKAIGIGAADQARGFLRDLDALDKKFSKLKDKVSSFHTGIRGAFTDFGDLMGGIGAQLEQFRQDQAAFLSQGADGTLVAPTAPDIGATIASQVGQAQLLAQLLKQLQQQGLSTANLSSLAGQGAGALPIAQALLGDPALIDQLNQAQQQIADITQTTADKLTAAAFGDKVERMSSQLETLLEELNKFQDGLHVPELTDATRDFINQLRRLNDALASLGIGGGSGGGGGAAVRDSLLALKRRNVTTGL